MAEARFGSDWSITCVNGVMQRVKNIEHNPGSTIVVEKEIFDSLIRIAEVASKLNNTTVPFKQIVLDVIPSGYQVSISSEIMPEVTAVGSSIVEALLHALNETDAKRLRLIE